MSVTGIYEIIYSPFCGAIVDKLNFKKWGKYRTWLFVGPLIVLVANAFKYLAIGTPTVNAVIIIIAFIITNSVYNSTWAANLALTSTLTTDPKENILIFSRRIQYFAAGRMSYSFIGIPLMAFFATLTNPNMGVTLSVFVCTLAFVAAYWAQGFMTKAYDLPNEHVNDSKNERVTFSGMLKALFQNPPLMILMVTDTLRQCTTFIVLGTGFYYFKYVVENPAMLATLILFYNLAGMIASLFAPTVYKFLKNKKLQVLIGLGGWTAFLVAAYFMSSNPLMVLILIACSQVCFGIGFAFVNGIYSDTVVYSEWKTGNPNRGFIMGIAALPVKIATLIKGVVISAGLMAIGFVADMAPTAEVSRGISQMVMLIPAAFVGIAFVVFLFYGLSEKKMDEMREIIEERKKLEEETVN
ncbi:MAG: MFS transporter, partial [Eubacterium sp.]